MQSDQKLEVRTWIVALLAYLPKCLRSVRFLMAMGRLPTKAVRCRRSASSSDVNLGLCSAESKDGADKHLGVRSPGGQQLPSQGHDRAPGVVLHAASLAVAGLLLQSGLAADHQKEATTCSFHVLPPSQRQHAARLLARSCCCAGLVVSSSICCCQSRLAGVPLPSTIS